MSPSEIEASGDRIDWRGWIALAWVVCFGVLYSRTVIETRGGKLRAAVASWSGASETAQFARTADEGRVANEAGAPGLSIMKASRSRPEASNDR